MDQSEKSRFLTCYEESVFNACNLASLQIKQGIFPNVSSLIVNEIWIKYSNGEKLSSNLIELFIESMEKDLDYKMDKSISKYRSAILESAKKKFSIIRELNIKIQNTDWDKHNLSFFLTYSPKSLNFDLEFSEINWNRVNRLCSSSHSSDAFPPLRELSRQSFEQLYRPVSKEIHTIVEKFTGSEEIAFYFSENLLSYKQCYEEQKEKGKRYYSDVREIRNCDSHFEFYEKDDKIVFKSSKIEQEFAWDDMLTYMVVCASNYQIMYNLVPFLHLAVLQKIETNI